MRNLMYKKKDDFFFLSKQKRFLMQFTGKSVDTSVIVDEVNITSQAITYYSFPPTKKL